MTSQICCLVDRRVPDWAISSFFFTPQRFLEALTMETLWSYWFLFFRRLLTSPSFPIFNWQINLDNYVLVSCLLMSSVKKNNYLACSLNFSLNLACCSVDYLSQTVHFCLHYNYMQFIIPILVLFFVEEIHLAGISTSSLLNIVFLRQVLWKHMALL